LEVLKNKPFQTILSSHSTHISSNARLSSLVLLTNTGLPDTIATNPCSKCKLAKEEIDDLERYLDATRSTLLYARKVILVEGPAEQFIIPPLAKKIMKIDLERYGVSVIPIYGVHFDVYAKLFDEMGMPKKCAIIADGDLKPSDSKDVELDEDTMISVPDLKALSNEYVGVFRCQTTFERALTIRGLLNCLAVAANECGAKRVGKRLSDSRKMFDSKEYGLEEKKTIMSELRDQVLAVSKRIGKARFAQIVSKHIDLAEEMPSYISDAIKWLEL